MRTCHRRVPRFAGAKRTTRTSCPKSAGAPSSWALVVAGKARSGSDPRFPGSRVIRPQQQVFTLETHLARSRPVPKDAIRRGSSTIISSASPLPRHLGTGQGATFVVEGEPGARRFSFWYEPERPPDGSPGAISEDMMVDQAMGELQVALGEQPDDLVYKWPRPSFMPSFSWTPPLPRVPPTREAR